VKYPVNKNRDRITPFIQFVQPKNITDGLKKNIKLTNGKYSDEGQQPGVER